MNAEEWMTAIDDVCSVPDRALSNRLVTDLHYRLSEALGSALGRDAGPNFHSWAVWGSRKAGATIRQEDLGDAIQNATKVAGMVGALTGAVTGVVAGRKLGWARDWGCAGLGASLGAVAGGFAGKQIALWSREKAARLVLEGNHTVLKDIGTQSARFLEMLERGATEEQRRQFFAGLRAGSTETFGQDRLAKAFRCYLRALDSDDPAIRREAMIAGNCETVYHEHIRLEPYIRGAMPMIVRRCATQRLMTYEIGDRVLAVGDDIPGVKRTAAGNWANIKERMRYVFALFREFHDAPDVFAAP